MYTHHSFDRAKERLGLNKKTAEHMMRNAIERGKDKTMFSNEEKRQWLMAKEAAFGYRALVYNGSCFIVAPGDVVVTIYPLPHWFTQTKRYSGKERIRNQAKYDKFNRSTLASDWVM